jgi:hypothetical protein
MNIEFVDILMLFLGIALSALFLSWAFSSTILGGAVLGAIGVYFAYVTGKRGYDLYRKIRG